MRRVVLACLFFSLVACARSRGRRGGHDATDAGPGLDAGIATDAPVDAPAGDDAGFDAAPGDDAGFDAGPADAGRDAGPADAGRDAGPADAGRDAGPADAGRDAGPADAGRDAGPLGDGTSCRALLAAGMSRGDGVYRVDLDGAGGAPAFDAYCDMTTAGGGWTLTYKVRSNLSSALNPWWNMVMPGAGTALPTALVDPVGAFEGPTSAVRADFTTRTSATEWRAQTRRGATVIFDVRSSYAGDSGRGLRCFAAGTCATTTQTCSASATDGVVIATSLPGPFAAGGTGYVCDVGWTDCDFCVDWSEVRTDSSAGGSTDAASRYVGDDSIMLTDTTTYYFVR